MRKSIVSLGLLSHLGTTLALQLGAVRMPVQAQIVPDATLPSNSQVTANGSSFTIDGGTVRGSNHFHSFTEFSVPTGAEALFNNGSAIDNIITRVTGGSISNIDGLIRAHGGANLFLLNPNGIVFGPNARLDIGGSFLGSTAESLLFDDGSFYSTTNPEAPPLLTINVPLGLQLGPNSGSIRVLGPGHNLTQEGTVIRDNRPTGVAVAPGNSLALVGAEVDLEGGNLTAIDGRVELGGVIEGRVGIDPTTGGLEYENVQNFGEISLSGAASIDASGGGGTVQLVGRQIQLREASAIVSNATGPADSGPFVVRATESVEMIGDSNPEALPTGLFNQVERDATGNSGELTIVTGLLRIADGALVSNSTAGIGSTGALQVMANLVEIRGQQEGNVSGLYSQVLPFADGGNSGNMTIVTEKLSILDRGVISTGTFGDGNAGDLIIRATESVELRGIGSGEIIAGIPIRESSSIFSAGGSSPRNNKLPDTVTGNAGNIRIDTGQLILSDGAFILSSTARSQDGANLIIRATDSIILRGNNPSASPFRETKSSFLLSGVDAALLGENLFVPTANGGNITIDTGRLILADGARISAETQGIGNAGNLSIRASESVQLMGVDNEGHGSSLLTTIAESAIGDAGAIRVETDRLMLADGATISSETRGEGNSGNVIVRSQFLSAIDRSQLSVSSQIPENFGAGTLDIAAGKIELENQAGLRAETAAGSQGNINVQSQDLRLRGDAFISTNATGTATGGNITINADTIVGLFNSDISANAIQGSGGNIFIGTSGIFLSPDSEITATSEFGVAGTVTIFNPNADPGAGLKLPENRVDGSSLLGKDFCEVSKNSSFIITGRGGIPSNPHDYLSPNSVRVNLVDPVISDDSLSSENVSRRRGRPEVNRNRQRQIVEATGFVQHPDGTIELVADASAAPPVLKPVNCHDLAREN